MRVRISDSVSVHVERRLKLLLGGFPCSTHPIAGADSGAHGSWLLTPLPSYLPRRARPDRQLDAEGSAAKNR
jgi:hypothetical protein